MFIGHLAPALAVAAVERRPRLGPLVLAALLPDIALWLLVLAGVERIGITPGLSAVSPFDFWDVRWSHSLVGTLGWAAGFAIAVKLLTRDARAAWLAAMVVASHWVLDLVVHLPDLTVAGAGQRLGWGLWAHPYLSMPLELLLAFAAFAFYLDSTRAADWRGRWAPAVFAGAAVVLQLGQWLARAPAETMLDVPRSVPLAALATIAIVVVPGWWTGDLRVPRRGRPGLRVTG